MEAATCPAHLNITTDHRLFAISDAVGIALAKHLAELGMSPRSGVDARNALMAWCADIAEITGDSSRWDVVGERLDEAFPLRNEEMMLWLRGLWSTRDALEEMCWRLQFHPTAITAALWLYEQSEPPSESRRQAVAIIG